MCQVALFSIARMSGDSRLVNFCNRDGGLSYINPTLWNRNWSFKYYVAKGRRYDELYELSDEPDTVKYITIGRSYSTNG